MRNTGSKWPFKTTTCPLQDFIVFLSPPQEKFLVLWHNWDFCKYQSSTQFSNVIKGSIWLQRFRERERDKASTSNDSVLKQNYLERTYSILDIRTSYRSVFITCVSISDIDECQTLRPCSCGVPGEPCGANCVNLVPGYKCTCAPGFQLRSGGTICDGNV